MEYKDIKVQDLLQDESFVKWVVNPNEALDKKWNNWITEHGGQTQTLAEARELILSMSFNDKEQALPDGGLWQKIETTIESKKYESESSDFRNLKYLLRIAVVLVLVSAVSVFYYSKNQKNEEQALFSPPEVIVKQNPNGVKTQLRLPDGTKVWLNSGSKLIYPATFTQNSRNIELYGEAFFDVVEDKSKPFVIQTPYFQTTVLGTSFSVKAYDNYQPKVSLVEGKLKVSKLGIDRIIHPGEQIVLKGEQLALQPFDYAEEIGWTEGILFFKEDNITSLFSKLESWYGVTIEFDENKLPDSKYSGEHKNQSLETVLRGISYSLNFDYEKKDKNIKIMFNPNK
ncbi:FecR family protein [Reichenbachiella sp. MALMAid0571]|uniref:FecR family protein n=1 Tax=Reichenbachiella sp. MALMAid0571 TaxID=3143939 RepID=UPI0032DEF544